MRPSEVPKEGSEEELKTEVSSVYLDYNVVNCELSSTIILSHVFQCSLGIRCQLLVHVINYTNNIVKEPKVCKQRVTGNARGQREGKGLKSQLSKVGI